MERIGGKQTRVAHPNDPVNSKGGEVEGCGRFLLRQDDEFAWGASDVYGPAYFARVLSRGCLGFTCIFCNNRTSRSNKEGAWDVVAIGEEMGEGRKVGVDLRRTRPPDGALPSLVWSPSQSFHHLQSEISEIHLPADTIRG